MEQTGPPGSKPLSPIEGKNPLKVLSVNPTDALPETKLDYYDINTYTHAFKAALMGARSMFARERIKLKDTNSELFRHLNTTEINNTLDLLDLVCVTANTTDKYGVVYLRANSFTRYIDARNKNTIAQYATEDGLDLPSNSTELAPRALGQLMYDQLLSRKAEALVDPDLVGFITDKNPHPPAKYKAYLERVIAKANTNIDQCAQDIQEAVAKYPPNEDQATRLLDQASGFQKLREDLAKIIDNMDNVPLEKTERTVAPDIRQTVARYPDEDKKITIEIPLRVEINADKRIQDVWQNLISNAVKYAKNRIHIKGWETDDFAVIVIADDGVGIDKDQLEKIFDAGYQAPGAIESTGVGLAYAKDLVDSHGGLIGVVSEIGQGSAFYCILPLPLQETVDKRVLTEDLLKEIDEVRLRVLKGEVDDNTVQVGMGRYIPPKD